MCAYAVLIINKILNFKFNNNITLSRYFFYRLKVVYKFIKILKLLICIAKIIQNNDYGR